MRSNEPPRRGIIGYAPDKKLVAGQLLRAIRDENEQVRNNATRGLAPIITLSQSKPELGIQIDPEPFVQMLHSLSWSDRNKAVMVLLALTKPRPLPVLRDLSRGALEPLIEMANWEDSHNRMALTLLGRIAGIPDSEAEDLKNRRMVIDRAIHKS
jgi:HEAT repeat protein